MSIAPDSHLDLLHGNTIWHIATIGPNGEVQSSPVWADWDGEHFKFSITRSRQKYKNLVANPTIAASGIDPADPTRYLELRGALTRVDDDSSRVFINSMAKKYADVDDWPADAEGIERVVMVVTPTHFTKLG